MRYLCLALIGLTALNLVDTTAARAAGPYVRLVPAPAPKITASAEDFPGGRFAATNLLDDNIETAYASAGKGVETFVEFDFGRPVPLGGFKHIDRRDPATIAASTLTFLDETGKTIERVPVEHVNLPAGETLGAFPRTIVARRVRWQVTKLGGPHRAVGGAFIGFFAAAETETAPKALTLEAAAVPVVRRDAAGPRQTLRVTIDYPYAQPIQATVRAQGLPVREVAVRFGRQAIDYDVPAITSPQPLALGLDVEGKPLVETTATVQPTRRTTVYILPHSHTDIGYTEAQTQIEDKQVNNLLLGMRYARQTANYPPGARFVWNVEVLWAADLYLQRLAPAQQAELLAAIKQGQVALCGMYLNELTGLCRPEELMRLFQFAGRLRQQTGATIDSAMISDVPGYTWGTVSAMAQAGIKYFSVAPNFFDRIGDILVKWENKPFYWVGPSGKEQVLVWIPQKGYALSHIIRKFSDEFIEQYQRDLDRTGYPYDIAYLRWAGHGDNAAPDPVVCDFVRDWSARYEWPKLVISSTGDAFRALEAKYGDKLPRVRGDWTPYWEDGAGSSSLETAQNRASSDRLVQAEALWAMLGPESYPTAAFDEAWRNVLLYSEHTWGAFCSISEPSRKETLDQWTIKQSYAVTADRQSRDLLSRATSLGQQASEADAIDVFNTTSWPRTDLVQVPKYLTEKRSRVLDASGAQVPSQRLHTGELVFLARNVPPLSLVRYKLEEGPPQADRGVTVEPTALRNEHLSMRLDPQRGGIVELRATGIDANFADTASGHALNDYLYLRGDNLAEVKGVARAKIVIKERGPLVASLAVESDAPGCRQLRREVRLVAGADHVELVNLVDKQRLEADNYHDKHGKESVNFAFPFHVPNGQVRLEVPYGVMRPDLDQIPSACKNWFTVGRWGDVSNDALGVTWVTLDAPLTQVGGLTATLLGSQSNPDAWKKQIGPTQHLYCWAMNNHWGTNYRAYQEGPVVFRFALRPHRKLDLAAASRLAVGLSQPLIATSPHAGHAPGQPRLTLDTPGVLVTGMKPSDDGRAVIVRLWAGGGEDAKVRVTWSKPIPKKIYLSNISEQPASEVRDAISIPAWGVVTLRAEW